MSIFSRIFHSRDKPKDSTNGSGYRYYYGVTTSGKSVNERSAMQLSATGRHGTYIQYARNLDCANRRYSSIISAGTCSRSRT